MAIERGPPPPSPPSRAAPSSSSSSFSSASLFSSATAAATPRPAHPSIATTSLPSSASTSAWGSRKLLFADIKSRILQRVSARWMFRLVKAFILVAIVIWCLWPTQERSPLVIDESYGALSSADPDIISIERECSASYNTCYSVVDVVNRDAHTVQRAMYIDGFEKEYDTIVHLVVPPGKTYDDSDTRMWRVNHTVLTTQYVAAMIVQLFGVAALSLEDVRDEESALLVIGLGGGNLDMFLHTKRPKIDITIAEIEPVVVNFAHRWFQAVDDAKRRTFLQDGIAMIADAKQRNRHFDAVIVDACDMAKDMPCPAKSFLQPETLRNIKAILKPMGVAIFNLLPLQNQEVNVELTTKTLLAHFPVCLKMRMSLESNYVLGCLPYAIAPDSLKDTKELISERLEAAAKSLGLNGVFDYMELALLDRP